MRYVSVNQLARLVELGLYLGFADLIGVHVRKALYNRTTYLNLLCY